MKTWSVVSWVLLIFCASLSVYSQGDASTGKEVYVVVMSNLPPIVTYEGTLPNFAATSVDAISDLDKTDPHVHAYQQHLKDTHIVVLERNDIDVANKLYSYRYAINGFAATLTPEEAMVLRQDSAVGSVELQTTMELATASDDASSSKFLKMKRTLWTDTEGVDNAGENIIIGVVDTGIWPEHPSFSDEGYDNILTHRPTWQGSCSTTPDFTACSNKIIGAKYFYQAMATTNVGGALDYPNTTVDFLSPRDSVGHGTHSASVAGGNWGVQVSYNGLPYVGNSVLGKLSGMAPRARLAIYKVFWTSTRRLTEGGSGLNIAYQADIFAAVDAATADGVDIINFSFTPGTITNFYDTVGIAALNAAKAGIFVSAAGGNRGPSPYTVLNFQPWITTVAATSDDREYDNAVVFGGGKFEGALNAPGTVQNYPLIMAVNATVPGGDVILAEYCATGTLSPSLISGKIVVCTNPVPTIDGILPQIIAEVAGKGAMGVVVRNLDPSMLAQSYSYTVQTFPCVQVSSVVGADIEEYYNSVNKPKARIVGVKRRFGNEAPAIMDFSSRGPIDNISKPLLVANSNDILKPDVSAPGFNVWGAYSQATGQLFQMESGTSASAPHISGIAALLKQIHPTWSPFAIKSAIMTTADTLDNRQNPLGYGTSFQVDTYSPDPTQGLFDYGSGFINTDDSTDPGLVYDSNFQGYAAFLFTVNPTLAAMRLGAASNPFLRMRARDLNLPNVGISNLRGSELVNRTVTRVGARGKATKPWTVSIVQPPGVLVTISPSTFVLAVNQSITFNITLQVTAEPTRPGFVCGSFTWSNTKYSVKSKIAVQPLSITK